MRETSQGGREEEKRESIISQKAKKKVFQGD